MRYSRAVIPEHGNSHSITTSKRSSSFQKNMFSIVENTRKLSECCSNDSFSFSRSSPSLHFSCLILLFPLYFFSSSSASFLPCLSPVTFCLYLFCLLLLPFLMHFDNCLLSICLLVIYLPFACLTCFSILSASCLSAC